MTWRCTRCGFVYVDWRVHVRLFAGLHGWSGWWWPKEKRPAPPPEPAAHH